MFGKVLSRRLSAAWWSASSADELRKVIWRAPRSKTQIAAFQAMVKRCFQPSALRQISRWIA